MLCSLHIIVHVYVFDVVMVFVGNSLTVANFRVVELETVCSGMATWTDMVFLVFELGQETDTQALAGRVLVVLLSVQPETEAAGYQLGNRNRLSVWMLVQDERSSSTSTCGWYSCC